MYLYSWIYRLNIDGEEILFNTLTVCIYVYIMHLNASILSIVINEYTYIYKDVHYFIYSIFFYIYNLFVFFFLNHLSSMYIHLFYLFNIIISFYSHSIIHLDLYSCMIIYYYFYCSCVCDRKQFFFFLFSRRNSEQY